MATLASFLLGAVYLAGLPRRCPAGTTENGSCSGNYFGRDCLYTCHCQNNSLCDKVTGKCFGTQCDPDWIGSNCQQRNIAYRKTATQSSVKFGAPAWLVVDGNKNTEFFQGSCSHTKKDHNPYLKVDLHQRLQIKNMAVYNRKDYTERSKNFQVYIGNNSWNLTPYYKQDGVPKLVVYINNSDVVVGRYVKIVVPLLVQMNLCEVQIGGSCEKYWFGRYCENQCNCRGTREVCDENTGVCQSGCVVGWWGTDCLTECPPGTFGFNCSQTCNCLFNDICVRFTGQCPHGCKAGWTGENGWYCNKICPKRTHGAKCSLKCSEKCTHQNCHHVDGHCTDGCIAGWTGMNCEQKCTKGTYGKNCSSTCKNCKHQNCHHIDGHCIDGCIPGRNGINCERLCPNRTYGMDCSHNCSSHCFNSLCHSVSGACLLRCVPKWTGEFCQTAVEEPRILFIIGIIIGIIVFIMALIVISIVIGRMYRRRWWNLRKTDSVDNLICQTASAENIQDKKNKEDNKKLYQKGYMKMEEFSVPENVHINTEEETVCEASGIKVEDLYEYLNKANKEDWFSSEYNSLPGEVCGTREAANKPENKKKNRYKNIVAYDHTRVVLENFEETDTDYINACYINGFKQPQAYIASQGPNLDTICDFWRMIWQVRCTTIVMLTNLVEGAKHKCEKYWPDSDVAKYGQITVRCVMEAAFADFTIRTFIIQKLNSTERKVEQYHFTSWSDHSVPPSPTALVAFRAKVKSSSNPDKGPTVIHCSAGVGRTGTYIALERLLEEAIKFGHVDVLKCVNDIRKQRMNMVQTVSQYRFIYDALLEALLLSESNVTLDRYPEYFNVLHLTSKGHTMSGLQKQFEDLKNLKQVPELTYETAKSSQNVSKNRSSYILLASDMHRPFLSPGADSEPKYINGAFLPSYQKAKAYIITQMPMGNTTEDFWQLVYDYKVVSVVMLNSIETMDETCAVYWSDSKIGPYTTQLKSSVDLDGYTDRTIFLKNLNEPTTESRTIKQFQFTAWPETFLVPSSSQSLLHLLEDVHQWQKFNSDAGPLLVHCLNGAERSGLFCTLATILELLSIEREINIPYVIRTLQLSCPQIMASLEQYQFCHAAVLQYLKQFQIYGN